ncbi:hypothetical protein IFM89_034987 [Coptis chinensis]|uniref:Uncharacterized protein n=1 Tax=Coptis chinensis TaxID=261450 RepID=A0A835IUF7_9MAGN|nr:hypothetical protein IFM89_034987 [Coptis chinensis]
MFVVDMSNNNPNSRTKDFFASPALSLSLAGVFRNAGVVASSRVNAEEGEEEITGGGGGSRGREGTVEISSENTGTGRSDEDVDEERVQKDDDDEDKHKKKKRKKYHRHTAEQIKEMEALFKESPHPDEKQRQQLSKKLGLAPRQVKFWFQNRRTQIKNWRNSEEKKIAMREAIKNACCPNCGLLATSSRDVIMTTEEQQLRIENARLKAEKSYARAPGRYPTRTMSPSSSCSAGNDQENRNSLDDYDGILGLERSKISEIADQAMEELTKMATVGEPLWIRSVETGREMLNYDEYIRQFRPEKSDNVQIRRSIEASRETGVIFVDLPKLVKSFMDVNQWKEMFPCLISKAATVDVLSSGETSTRDGAIQLMFAELQMLTPVVPTREVYFIRYCKQLSPDRWAIVDVSMDKVEDNIDSSLAKCHKRPSGCIIDEKSIGHCRVIWVEHLECHKSAVHTIYRSVVNNGLGFGAKHWMAALQHQCEQLVFFMATNVPTKDSSVSSVWLPVSPHTLFDFLRDETWRNEWDVLSTGSPVQRIANLGKGQDQGNTVTVQAMESKESSMWILQDSSTNTYESMVIYAPVDIAGMQSVMNGCDSSNVPILPSGFSILPDGLETRPTVITTRPEEKSMDGGSLLTIAFQVLANTSPTAKPTVESVDSANALISCTLQKIKTSLKCEEG